jgi:hypothetical protein
MRPSKGPWTAEYVKGNAEETYYRVVDANGRVIFDSLNSEAAEIACETDEEHSEYRDVQGEADLTLASAALELLEALEETTACLVETVLDKVHIEDFDSETNETVKRARAAIAKAKGTTA